MYRDACAEFRSDADGAAVTLRLDHAVTTPAQLRAESAASPPAVAGALGERWAQQLNRVDRVVSGARLALAAFSLLAVGLDPTQPTRFEGLAYFLLVAYLAFALCLAGLAWQRAPLSPPVPLAGHAVDLLAFTALLFLTSGPASPFFVLLTFALLSAALRRQWRGTLWMALAALLVHLLLPLWEGSLPLAPGDELNRYVIRATYLVVAALMLAYVGAHQTRLRGQLWRLADWPRHWKLDRDAPVAELLEHARTVAKCPRAMMAWSEPEEPWLNLAWTGESGVLHAREAPETFAPLVAALLEGETFVCTDCSERNAVVLYGDGRRARRVRVAPLQSAFAERFSIARVLSAPLPEGAVSGRLFLLDRLDFSRDDFLVAGALAAQCAVLLEQVDLLGRLRSGAALEERLRLARDLHDGLLQTLAAVSMQIEAISRTVDGDPQRSRQGLGEIQAMVRAEQRRLRGFVEETRPARPPAENAEVALAALLEDVVALERERWRIQVAADVDVPGVIVPRPLARELRSVLREACVNAVRHGRARRVDMVMPADDRTPRCNVQDDGHVFAFAGRLEGEALQPSPDAPRTILDRVTALRGRLALEARPRGARLELEVPLPARGS